MTAVRIAVGLIAATLVASCAHLPTPRILAGSAGLPESRQAGQPPPPTHEAAPSPLVDKVRAELGEGARYVVERQSLTVRGRTFPWDCTGTVCAIYWYAGIDLTSDFARYGGNGVKRLFQTLEAARLLYDTKKPLPGDIVFWDDTYDANGDGKWNDPLTHVGMVTEAERDGAISYVHLHIRRGIVVERMSLVEPAVYQRTSGGRTVVINAPLRLAQAGANHPDRWLAGQLYRILGQGYLLKTR